MSTLLFQKAVRCHTAGHLADAMRLYRTLLANEPDHAGACCNLGSLLRSCGKREEAIVLLWKAVTADPNNADAWHNLGNALQEDGNRIEALGCYRRAIATKPAFEPALLNMGRLLMALERYAEAEDALGQVTNDCQALLLLGSLNELQGRLADATSWYRQLLCRQPENKEALHGLGNVLLLQGKPEAALQAYRQAVQVDPTDLRMLSSVLLALQYHPTSNEVALTVENLCLGSCFGAGGGLAYSTVVKKPLHIGYVSGDFCSHPVGMFIKDVLRSHNMEQVIAFCYSNGTPRYDAITQEIKSCSVWREIGMMSDEEASALIAADEIDILVDLSGHTARNRMSLFARRAAPVQISWLGYFATTAVSAMDFVLMDCQHVPQGNEHFFTEKVLYLPNCRFCFRPPSFAPLPSEPPCLQKGYVTFGSFNSTAKLNEQVLTLWAELLLQVPKSRLILKWVTFADQTFCEEVRYLFRQKGVDDDRLELRRRSSHAEMLEQYADIDIALDPFPFCGGMTSCEALWMGVPVVTLPGERPVSRQTLCILKLLNLTELVAQDQHDYIRLASQFASQPKRLQRLRQELRQYLASSPLCNVGDFTWALEQQFYLARQHKILNIKK